MAVQPTENLPNWNPTNPSDRVEPSGSKKLQGYMPEEPLPAQHFNWLLYSISLWLQYLVDTATVIGFGLAGQGDVSVNTTRPITATDDGKVLVLDSSSGAFNLTLPLISTMVNKKLTIKDLGGSLSTKPVTLVRNSTEEIENIAANYVLEADYGTWNLYCDGVQYYFI